jgi:8-oxo-dGTP pyrophosphatase MutT (NUDIX family)/catechol 2,3-dioxygenase-like lactoylglutathione lyase family enzyme
MFDQGVIFLRVADLARSAAFYEDALGLVRVLDQGSCLIWRAAPRVYLGACLHQAPSDARDGVIVTLVTPDVEGWAARLAAAGVAIERGPLYNPTYKITHLFVRDPDGWLIELQRFEDPRWPVEQTTLPTRQNVAACLRDPQGRLLLCERIDHPGIWQLPQGGIDPSESAEQALERELREELGIDLAQVCRIVLKAPPVHYTFPDWLDNDVTRRFEGQDQTLFILDYLGDPDAFRLDAHDPPEFRAHAWLPPAEALDRIAPFKRHILAQALTQLV